MATLMEKMEARRKAREAQKTSADTADSDTSVTKGSPPPRSESSSTLLRQQLVAANQDKSVQYIDIDLIDVEDQVRKSFDQEHIEDLAIDFAANTSSPYQPDQPISVYRNGGRFLLSSGENRLRAVRWGRDHKAELGIDDVMAFTQIRATIIEGDMPDKLQREQRRVKENVMRNDLNDAELGRALLDFFKANPKATQADAVAWCGFQKANSGRVKVNRALKLMKLDADLIEQVSSNKLATDRAFKEQDLRRQQAQAPGATKTEKTAAKAPARTSKASNSIKARKSQTVELSLDQAHKAALLITELAQKHQLDFTAVTENSSRKEVLDLLNSPLLEELIKRIEQ